MASWIFSAGYRGFQAKVRGLPEVGNLARVNPLMAGVFPLVFLYSANIDEVPLSTAAPVILAVLLGTAIFAVVLRMLLRADEVAGVVAVVWLLLFFSYGHILETIAGESILGDGFEDGGDFLEFHPEVGKILLDALQLEIGFFGDAVVAGGITFFEEGNGDEVLNQVGNEEEHGG